MAKKTMKDEQKYRPANARGPGPTAEGKAKLRAAEKIRVKAKGMSEEEKFRRNYSDDSTLWGMRNEAGRKLAEGYTRSIGGKARPNDPSGYAKGGVVKRANKKSLNTPKKK